MKQKRTSFGFLMEMIWVSGFFLICACIFVLVFAKAESLSRRADLLNRAVQAASSAMEETFSLDTPADTLSTDDFRLTITASEENGILFVTVQVFDRSDDSILYSLSGARALPKGGAS